MDKYDYKLKTEQMLELMEKGAYNRAAEIADTIDWKRVRNATTLTNVSDIYERNGDYQKSYEVLNIAYHRAEGSRKVLYRLCALALKTGNVDEAIDYYDDFMQVAPKDPNQHILKYKMLRARRAPIEQQIEALEEFKKAEYIEEWAYELAKLYQEAGLTAECLEECDDLILWFSEGRYVFKAMELKMQYKPLTPTQQDKYDHRFEVLKTDTKEITDLTQCQAKKDAEQNELDHRYERIESETEEIPDLMQYQAKKDAVQEELDHRYERIESETEEIPDLMQYQVKKDAVQDELGHRYESIESQTEEIPDLTQYQAKKDALAEADLAKEAEAEETASEEAALYEETPLFKEKPLEEKKQEETTAADLTIQRLAEKGIGSTMKLQDALKSLLQPKREQIEAAEEEMEETVPELEAAIEEIESVIDLELVNGLKGKSEKEGIRFDSDLEELKAEPLEEIPDELLEAAPKELEEFEDISGELLEELGYEITDDSESYGDVLFGEPEEYEAAPAVDADAYEDVSDEVIDELWDGEEDALEEEELLGAEDTLEEEELLGAEDALKEEELLREEEPFEEEELLGEEEPLEEESVDQLETEKNSVDLLVEESIEDEAEESEYMEEPLAESEDMPGEPEYAEEEAGSILEDIEEEELEELEEETQTEDAYLEKESKMEASVSEAEGIEEAKTAENIKPEGKEPEVDQIEGQLSIEDILTDWEDKPAEEVEMENKKKKAEPILPPDIQRLIDEIEGVLPEEPTEPASPAKRTADMHKENRGQITQQLRIDDITEFLEADESHEDGLDAVFDDLPEEIEEYEEDLDGAFGAEEEYDEGFDDSYDDEYEDSSLEDSGESDAQGSYSEDDGYTESDEEIYHEEEPNGDEYPEEEYEDGYSEEEYEDEYPKEEYVDEYAEEEYEEPEEYAEDDDSDEYKDEHDGQAYEEYPEENTDYDDAEYGDVSEFGENGYGDIEASFEEEFRPNPEHISEFDDREIPDEDGGMDILSATTPLSRKETAKLIATGKTAPLPLDEISDALSMSDTGFVVHGRYDLAAQSGIGTRAGLTDEQKKLFSYFVPVRGMSEQLVDVLEQDRNCTNREGTSRTGNLLIIGNKGNGKTVLAVDVVKAIQKQRNIRQGKVAIVTGESLNKKKISDIFDKLYGGALIIEKAAKMNEKTVARLNKAMERETGDMMIVLEEQRKPLDRLLTSNREFRRKFTSRLEVPIFINDELVTFGQTYAQENGYRIDEMGILALYSRIDALQREDHAVTVAEVKEVMDEAMEHSQKASAKKLVKRVFGKNTDDADRIILSEKDFNF